MGTVFKDRVAKGLCGYCGKENDNLPLTYCKTCAEKRSQQYKERKEYYERHGWCNVCGNPEKWRTVKCAITVGKSLITLDRSAKSL